MLSCCPCKIARLSLSVRSITTLLRADPDAASELQAPLCSPNVHLAAYSRPHPSHTFINVRVQTTGQVSAAEALRSASVNVANVCDHIGDTFEQAMRDFEKSKPGSSGAQQAPADSEESSELSSSSGEMEEA